MAFSFKKEGHSFKMIKYVIEWRKAYPFEEKHVTHANKKFNSQI
jgi:hypothetical protein